MPITFEKLPPVSLHRLKIPNEYKKQVYSIQESEREALLLTIFSRIANKHELCSLEAGIQQVRDFSLMVFHTQAKGKSLIAKQLEPLNENVSLESRGIDYVIFFIRAIPQIDVFAATRGGRIYKILNRVIDYTFPHRAAKRFFNPTIRQLTASHLIGPILNSSHTYAGEPIFTQMDLQAQFVTKFVTTVKKDSSLLCRLSFHPTETTYGVQVKMKSVRFNTEFGINNFVEMLDQLSKLYCGEELSENDDQGFYFLDLVQKVSFKKSQKLQKCLLDRLWKLYQAPTSPTSLRFWHRYSDDFLCSSSFVFYSDPNVKAAEWTSLPSLPEVLDSFRQKTKINSKEEFIEQIKKSYFGFVKDGKQFKEKFSQFLTVEVMAEDGQIYFKNQGLWLKVSSEYLLLVQRDFLAHLRDCLISNSHAAQLPKKWISDKKWASFTFGEVLDVIKTVTEKPTKIQQIWQKIEKHAKPLEQDKKRKRSGKETEQQPGLVQTGLLGYFSQNQSLTLSLPDAKKRFLLTESIEGLERDVSAFLQHKFQLQKEVRNEGAYNELYIGEKGFLVGDRITPQGIELFDLLKFDGENLYLYQVKESISETTTKACSQLRNAARALSSTLMNPQASSNILLKFWEEVMTSQPKQNYFKKLKKSYEAFGREDFFSLFNRDRKQICFVLAVLDNHATEAQLCSEPKTKISLEAEDFEGICKGTPISARKILNALQYHGYIDQNNHISQSQILDNRRFFDLGEEIPKDLTNKVFYKIYRKLTRFNSTLAKVDISMARKMIEELGFSFKICQISRPDACNSSSNTIEEDEWSFSSLSSEDESSLILTPCGSYIFDGQEYTQVNTPPDGSCALHALWGEIDQDGCRAKNPKECYAQILIEGLSSDPDVEGLLTACQQDLLESALSLAPSNEAKMVYTEKFLGRFSFELIQREEDRKSKQASLILEEGKLWVQLLNGFYPSIKMRLMKEVFQREGGYFVHFTEKDDDIRKLMKAIDGQRDDLYRKINNPEETEAIDSLFKRRIDDSAIQTLKSNFVRERQVREHYLATIQQPHYYFSTQELKLAAYLTNRSVVIFSERVGSMDIVDRLDFKEEEEKVFIYHHFPESQHFSRLVLSSSQIPSEGLPQEELDLQLSH